MSGRRVEIAPLSRHRWVVRYADDPTPLSEHETLTEARAAAVNWARRFGEPEIDVHELDGERHTEHVDPAYRAPTLPPIEP